MSRTPPRRVSVLRHFDLAPNLRRIVFGGTALQGFPTGSDGDHIKVMLPQPHQAEPVLPTLGPNGPIWPAAEQRPIVRTYSVSQFDAVRCELAVDFVLHGDNGPASRWANRVEVGAVVGIAGPGGPARIDADADWVLLVADPSSLAALQAALHTLPSTAVGHALIEVASDHEQVPLQHPTGVKVQWLMRGAQPAGESRLLLHAIQTLAWPTAGQLSVMLAGESHQLVAIRDFLLLQRGLAKTRMYAVPYWKDQHDEESYHAERHRIMDELA